VGGVIPASRGLGLLVGTLAALHAGGAVAQSHLLEVRAVVAVGEGSARVEIDYSVVPDGTVAVVPLEGLAFRPTRVEDFRASVDGRPSSATLREDESGRLTAALPLPERSAREVRIRVSYSVSGATSGDDPVRIRVPILAVGWPSEEALPGTFEAEVSLSERLTVYESFPSGLRAAGPGLYRLQLPAAPALLSIRATLGEGAPLGGMVQVLDALVLLVLLVLAWAGWRHFGRTVEG
jgi:hypothetical protein